MYSDAKNKMVSIRAINNDFTIMSGSGFFVKSDTIVTNYHVVAEGSKSIYVTLYDGRVIKSTDVDYSLKHRDIAFITVIADVEPVVLSDYLNVEELDEIMSIGNPLSLYWSANHGYVSALRLAGDVDIPWIYADTKIIQHSISSDGGSSGSAVFNKFGEVIGVHFCAMNESSGEFRFAVSSDYIREWLNQ